MIDKIYENLVVKKENFGQWTEEIIKEGLREAYELGKDKGVSMTVEMMREMFQERNND